MCNEFKCPRISLEGSLQRIFLNILNHIIMLKGWKGEVRLHYMGLEPYKSIGVDD
jgi:hypothetical protein